jgi:ribonuclease HII
MCCNYDFENQILARNYNYICGIDEVGRGALFGPVVAGAVILDPQDIPHDIGIDDSKKLNHTKRLQLSHHIYSHSLAYSIGWCWNDEIDRYNILEATKKAMKMAVKGLQINPDYVLMDGMKPDFLHIDGQCVIKGDKKSLSIAAAAIIAKVFRDDLMVSFHYLFPQYHLHKHKGYGTRKHIDALIENGLTGFHRQSFKISIGNGLGNRLGNR